MRETIRYAELRTRLGQRLYRATGSWWDGDDLHTVADGDYRTVPAAKLAARSWLAKGATQIDIRRGSYVEARLRDEVYGTVRDADWHEDDGWVIHGWVDAAGGIDWGLETW